MKVENNVNIPSIKNRNPQFTGILDETLRFLNTNQAWGANAVDLGCMVLPRTITDFSRGTDAGVETLRRESMGTINDSAIGLYGTVAGLILATALNRKFGLGKNDVKLGKVFADSETLDLTSKIWSEKLQLAKADSSINPLREFLKETIQSYEGLSPDENGKWLNFKNKNIDKVLDILEKEIKSDSTKFSKQGLADAKNLLIAQNNIENNFRIIAKAGERIHSSRYDIESILQNIHKLSKLYTKDSIKKTFLEKPNIAENVFLKAVKKMNLKRSLWGVAIGSAVGMATQPINIYLTKRKTGQESFVGGGEKDNSLKFKIEKGLVSALFGGGVLATIGNPKDLIKNLQFKGFTPTIKQFKFIYGMTIISRFLAARNENELTESAIKDTLGFANWLILGNFVQKLVAQSMDSTLIKRDGEGIINWITKSTLKTRDEVLHSILGKNAFTKEGHALNFSQMMKAVADNKIAKKKLGILTIAQLSGYLYSGLVLGFGIPKLNIYLTNRREAKKKAMQDKQVNNTANNLDTEFLNKFTGRKLIENKGA